ncbi:MAG: methyltransferase [Chitinophagales bacterium]|nr:MAG: methyltransferase [Chitinophagales bacterium]
MIDFWNQRYATEAYAYGEQPNAFFKEQIQQLKPGVILLPCEGEGRNAVYAAKLGWETFAFDQSSEGRKKALRLAEKHAVTIHYVLNTFEDLPYAPKQFDAIALIFAHFPSALKATYFGQLHPLLKAGGTVIFEGFSKQHLRYNLKNEKAGGPKDADMLYSAEEIKTLFSGYAIQKLAEEEIVLNEGLFHVGEASVVRFVGQKTNDTGSCRHNANL